MSARISKPRRAYVVSKALPRLRDMPTSSTAAASDARRNVVVTLSTSVAGSSGPVDETQAVPVVRVGAGAPPVGQFKMRHLTSRLLCRAIDGDPLGAETLYCGAPVVEGKSYCLDHFERYTLPRPERVRR